MIVLGEGNDVVVNISTNAIDELAAECQHLQ